MRNCLIELRAFAAPALYREFDDFRPFSFSTMARLDAQAPVSIAAYEAFCHEIGAARLLDFFARWPVVARRVAVRIEQWIDGSQAMLTRTRQLEAELARHSGDPARWPTPTSQPDGRSTSR